MDVNCLISPRDDRRTFQRFALNMLVFVRLPAALRPALGDIAVAHDERIYSLQTVAVRDISMTGLFFFSRLAYPAGADLEVCLCLDKTEYRVATTVKRRVRVDNQLCGYGISFRQSQTSKELRAALTAFLLRQAVSKKTAITSRAMSPGL